MKVFRSFLLGLVLVLIANSFLSAKVVSPEKGVEIAEMHGQPMFVMLGREGCPNCTITKKNLSDPRFQPLLSRYSMIYVNADVPPPTEIKALKESPGNILPFLYIVRADGKALYSSSGVVDNKRLAMELRSGIAKSGNTLPLKKSQALAAAVEDLQDDLSGDNLPASIQAVSRLKRFGPIGKIPSYAKPAVDANQLVEKLAKKCNARLDALQEKFDQGDPKFQDLVSLAQMVRVSKGIPEIQKRSRRMWTGVAKKSATEESAKEAKKLERAVATAKQKKTNADIVVALEEIAHKQTDAAAKQYVADELTRLSAEK